MSHVAVSGIEGEGKGCHMQQILGHGVGDPGREKVSHLAVSKAWGWEIGERKGVTCNCFWACGWKPGKGKLSHVTVSGAGGARSGETNVSVQPSPPTPEQQANNQNREERAQIETDNVACTEYDRQPACNGKCLGVLGSNNSPLHLQSLSGLRHRIINKCPWR